MSPIWHPPWLPGKREALVSRSIDTPAVRPKGPRPPDYRNLGYLNLTLTFTDLVLVHFSSPSHFLSVCALLSLAPRTTGDSNGSTNNQGQVQCQKKGSRPQGFPIVGSLVPDIGYALFIPASNDPAASRRVQVSSTPILAQSALPLFHEASSSTDTLLQSPLYALNGIWSTAPSAEDVVGGISAIIWALTLLPLLKYVSVLASEVLHV